MCQGHQYVIIVRWREGGVPLFQGFGPSEMPRNIVRNLMPYLSLRHHLLIVYLLLLIFLNVFNDILLTVLHVPQLRLQSDGNSDDEL